MSSPEAARRPAASARLLPLFLPSPRRVVEGKRDTTAAVASVEPSSTTLTSFKSGCLATARRTAPIRGASSYAQIMQEILGIAITNCISCFLAPPLQEGSCYPHASQWVIERVMRD